MKINDLMIQALLQAEKALEIGEVPIGAVIFHKPSGKIIGTGYNRREIDKDPLAHAELIAIHKAAIALGGWRLSGCQIIVTLEPCPMCCGGIINSRIDDVYFGSYDLKAGSALSVQEMFSFAYNHKPNVYGGIMEEACTKILSDFFKTLR